MILGVRLGISRSYDRPAPRVKPKSNRRPRYCVCWIRPAQRWENIEVRGGSGKVSGSGLARRYLGHTNRSRGKEYRPVANCLLSKRIDLDRRTKSEGYVSKSPISCKLPLGVSQETTGRSPSLNLGAGITGMERTRVPFRWRTDRSRGEPSLESKYGNRRIAILPDKFHWWVCPKGRRYGSMGNYV